MSEDNCPLCKIIRGELKSLSVYEDEQILAVIHPIPAHKGHLIVFAKEHKQIITEVPDDVLGKMYGVAQKLSTAVFDAFGAQGTNVLMQNGEIAGQTLNHFCIHVVPRSDGDGIQLEWQPKQGDENQLNMMHQKLQAAAQNVSTAPGAGDPSVISGDDNYLIKNLKRTP